MGVHPVGELELTEEVDQLELSVQRMTGQCVLCARLQGEDIVLHLDGERVLADSRQVGQYGQPLRRLEDVHRRGDVVLLGPRSLVLLDRGLARAVRRLYGSFGHSVSSLLSSPQPESAAVLQIPPS